MSAMRDIMDSLNSFLVFVRVAEVGSFVAAGRAMGISASAVGKSVARLEAKLSVRLFHRTTRSITLTAEGDRLLERSRRILAEIEAVQAELVGSTKEPRGRLRISLPVMSTPLLPVLGDFMRKYPKIELDLDFTDRLVDVVGEGFDAVIRAGEPADSRLQARKLGSFHSVLVASSEYLAQKGTPLLPADLLSHTCLHYRFPHSGKLEPWEFNSDDSMSELTLPVSMICNNIESRISFARQGLGLAYLPEFAIKEHLSDGTLRPVLTGYTKRTGVFYVLWPSGKHLTLKVRVLIDFLRKRVLLES